MDGTEFHRVLRDHKHRVWNYACYMLGDRAEAEDVTQEVFLKTWQRRDGLESDRVLSWMLRVTHNRCVDILRRRRPERCGRTTLDEDMEDMPASADTKLDPALAYELTETQEALVAALGTLPQRTRSMLLLHHIQGLKHSEVAEVMGATVNTVKVTVHRGRRALRTLLAHRYQPERKVSNG